MRMHQLAILYHAMKKENRTKEQFRFSLNHVNFDVIFVTDTAPFQLLVGIKTHNFFFTVPIHPGFQVGLMDDDTFFALRNFLNFQKQGEKFTSFKFLAEVDNHAPATVSKNEVQPHELYAMLPLSQKSKVEESEKIYFAGWNYHRTDGRKARNFEKTFLMTGSQEIADFCRKHNISSMWSDNPNDKNYLDTPW